MTQRVTVDGEEWELLEEGILSDKQHDYVRFLFRKVEKPAPKESERLLAEYDAQVDAEWGGEQKPAFVTGASIKMRARLLADYILARCKEELL